MYCSASAPATHSFDSQRVSPFAGPFPSRGALPVSAPPCFREAALGISQRRLLEPGEREPERAAHGLTAEERRLKIKRFLEKRKRRIWNKKVSYDCRKKVADKRLRIKGRFVTREQAYAVLGTTQEDLLKNKELVELIRDNVDCSIVASAQNVKVRNIQTLVNLQPADSLAAGEKLSAAAVKEDRKSQVLEIKIQPGKEPKSEAQPVFERRRTEQQE